MSKKTVDPVDPKEKTFKIDHLHMPEEHMEEVYTSGNPLVKYAHQDRLNTITAQLPDAGPLLVLDAGCGEGHLIERMLEKKQKHHYTGVDVTPVALEKARERCPQAEFGLANLAKTAFEDNFFDVITCTEVIEHIFEYQQVISELKRILKPGGMLIMTFPNEVLWTASRFLLGRRPIKVPDHVNSFTPKVMHRQMALELEKQINLPFRLPFALSLGCAMVFRKPAV